MILIDNTVLSNFAAANQIPLLKDFCGDQGCVTPEIIEKFRNGIIKGFFKENNDLTWLQIITERKYYMTSYAGN